MMDEDGSLKYRSGPWTKEEEEYAQALMKAFRAGHLDDLEEGTLACSVPHCFFSLLLVGSYKF